MMTALFKDLLHYNPETGVFIRLSVETPGNQRFVGEPAGYLTKKGYRRINIDGKSYSAHLLAWFFVYGVWPEFQLDHKNGNKDDNRISNLRSATGVQNQQNRNKLCTNTSGFKGVSWLNRKRPWRAHIRYNNHQIYLGCFDTPEAASIAYNEAAQKYHGEFARYDL